MKNKTDVIVTGGLWSKILGKTFTEIVKQEATSGLERNVRLWAWDADPRGIRDLVPEHLHKPENCLEAWERYEKLITAKQNGGDAIAGDLHSVIPMRSEIPLLALATITSKKTFRKTLELLQPYLESGRRILLLVLADHPQSAEDKQKLESSLSENQTLLADKLSGFSDQIRVIRFSRAMFLDRHDDYLASDRKALAMKLLEHVSWLWFTNEAPSALTQSLFDRMDAQTPWSLGHIQFDTSGEILDDCTKIIHTRIQAANPELVFERESKEGSDKLHLKQWNYLGSPSERAKAIPVFGFVFSDEKKEPTVSVKDAKLEAHFTHRMDQTDVLLLLRSGNGAAQGQASGLSAES
jgi:hypothetical protein